MANFREQTIKAVKAMNIKPCELGLPTMEAFETVTDERYSLLRLMKEFIKETDTKEIAKKFFDEEDWEELGIKDEKYKVVEVNLSKTVHTTIKVAVRTDDFYMDSEDAIWGAIGDEQYLDYDDEDSWEIDNYAEEYEEKTEDQIRCRTDLYNEGDF